MLFLDGKVQLIAGDCIKALALMPENSVDSAVMDPPYHLTSIVDRCGKEGSAEMKTAVFQRASAGFMGRKWDGGDIAFQVDTWKAVYRVLKPGAYILAFASTRGFGRMSVAIEDAGFIVHPLIAWVFGSGFPKATRIKAEGYDGFRYGGQALKPAIEPIFMGQKPFSEATGTANILKHGTGAVNIDGCRVGDEELQAQTAGQAKLGTFERHNMITPARVGRWPANLIHDGSEEVIAAFPEAPGQIFASTTAPRKSGNVYGAATANRTDMPPRDAGDSAARFFYSAKADADDRIGSKHPTVKPVSLIRYLARLITPPGGVILDPFAGTGTLGEAAYYEGFRAILIEKEEEYQRDIARRMALVLAGPDEKRRESVKAAGKTASDHGPLFSSGDF